MMDYDYDELREGNHSLSVNHSNHSVDNIQDRSHLRSIEAQSQFSQPQC
jgi:hypothetical protein